MLADLSLNRGPGAKRLEMILGEVREGRSKVFALSRCFSRAASAAFSLGSIPLAISRRHSRAISRASARLNRIVANSSGRGV